MVATNNAYNNDHPQSSSQEVVREISRGEKAKKLGSEEAMSKKVQNEFSTTLSTKGREQNKTITRIPGCLSQSLSLFKLDAVEIIDYQILPSFQTPPQIRPVSILSSGNHVPKEKKLSLHSSSR